MQKNQLILSINSLEIQQISEFHDLKGQFFFYEEILHAKKILKKHISKYTLTKHSNKRLLIYILRSLCFLREL